MTPTPRRPSPSVPLLLATALLVAAGTAARAGEPDAPAAVRAPAVSASSKGSVEKASGASDPVVYVPPRRGAPRAKVGGGLRGARAMPTLLALAPDHLAQTFHADPSLFWHIDGAPPGGSKLLFTLIDDAGIDPIAEVEIPRPAKAGIQRIDLGDHGIALEPGIEYQWSIALVVDPRRRAEDRLSVGYIRRVPRPSDLPPGAATAQAYAERGLWYDALESISDAVEAAPGDGRLRGQRNDLLRQADLDAAVE